MANFKSSLLLCTLLASSILPAGAKIETFKGKVVGVSDGDTISVLVHGNVRKIRLNGVDCPEKTQAFGQQAKLFTSKKSFSKTVKIVSTGHDRYRRFLADVILPDGSNLNDLLLEHGYAWWYSKFSKDEHRHELEEIARKQKRGLWQDSNAAAPWEYRHRPPEDATSSGKSVTDVQKTI